MSTIWGPHIIGILWCFFVVFYDILWYYGGTNDRKTMETPWKKTRKSHGNFNLDEATDRWLGEMGAMSVAWKGRIPWMWKIPMSL